MVALGTKEFYVEKDVLDEPCLDMRARKRTHSNKPPLRQQLKDSLRCSGPRLKRTVLGCIPVLSWLPLYRFREYIMGDIVAGISVGIMHMPQGMAYALLASVPPVFGLYTSFYPVLVYFFFGTSRHISIGTFAVISVMVGSVTERMAPDSQFMIYNGTNGTAVLDTAMQDAYKVQVASSLSLLVGIFQILLGLVRFGFLATYLSEPLVCGYTTAAAIQVVLSQLKFIFGVETIKFNGPLSQIYTLVNVCSLLPKTNIGTFVVSLVVLSILIVVKELNSCHRKKLPMPIPIELMMELVALGVSNSVGGFFQCYAVTSSMSRSMVQESTGGKTQTGEELGMGVGALERKDHQTVVRRKPKVAGGGVRLEEWTGCSLVQSRSPLGRYQVPMASVFSSVLILVVILKVGSLFEELPKFCGNRTRLIWSQLPRYSVLGHVPGTELYLDMDTYEEAKKIPGITIFQSSTALYYANEEFYKTALEEKSGIDVKKMLTMKRQQEAVMEREKKKFSGKDQRDDMQTDQGNGIPLSIIGVPTIGHFNWAFRRDSTVSDTGATVDMNQMIIPAIEGDGEDWRRLDIHTIILDFSTFSFADTVTVKTLKNIFRDFGELGVDMNIAGCQVCVVEQLETAGLFSESLPKSLLFPTIHHSRVTQPQTEGGGSLAQL
ncbi:solute carrier family 26 member 6-like [Hypomesus transpacificus]|uniref:solute carrier family 26 member 6-like n=1 Tax=Hypomesus transpacificus TaxID=137520 RepID=UPI001F087589|nr:solute carrier family 26 member 6-like [Hypomesus transpacificus]